MQMFKGRFFCSVPTIIHVVLSYFFPFYFVYTKVLYYCHLAVTWTQSHLVYFHVYGPSHHLRSSHCRSVTYINANHLETLKLM